jgi:integrase
MLELYIKQGKKYKQLNALAIAPQLAPILKTTIKEATDKYIKKVTSTKCIKNQNNEKSYFLKFNNFFIVEKITYVDEITLEHLEDLQKIFLRMMKPSSCIRRFSVYSNFFNKCIQWNFITKNPILNLKRKKIEPNPFKKWSKEDYDSVLAESSGAWRDALQFLWYTGCRPSEALGLKWTDINYNDCKLVLRSGKNANLSREFEIKGYTDKLLHSIKPTCLYVFAINKEPLNNDNFYQYIKHRLKKLKLDHLTVYGVRHGFAGRCEDSGIQLSHIQKLLGHADIRTTMRYINPSEKELSKSLEKIKI